MTGCADGLQAAWERFWAAKEGLEHRRLRLGPVAGPGRQGTFIGRVIVEVRPPDLQQALLQPTTPIFCLASAAEVLGVPVQVPATALHSREAHGSGGEGRGVADLRFRLRLRQGRRAGSG